MVRLCLLTILLATPAVAEQSPRPGQLKLHATLVMLPRTEPCNGRVVRVTALYRVDKVLEGRYDQPTILVVQRCPEVPRGPTRFGRGDAGALRPGKTHLLTLRPLDAGTRVKITDPFADDPRPRWEALRTDRSDWPPRIVVVIEGGGGTRLKLTFDADAVSVGRAADSDVLLSAQMVAMRHLRLVLVKDQVQVHRIGSSRALLGGKPMKKPMKITFQDRIVVGPYTLRVALFLKGEDD